METKFERMLKKIHENKLHRTVLRAVSYITALLSVGAFVYLCVSYYLKEPISVIEPIIICGVPFAIVSVFRRIVDVPRPYEVYSLFGEDLPKDKKGRSFPSRHTFSAFVIGTLLAFTSLSLGIALLIFALAMAIARVLLGVHFVRDVVAGGAIGIASAVIGFAIFIFI
ncbi:MAG: phosphatase PAP2 family protein [Clostridia bacterium]|nr:phosphatase PAP2 family protein [Clostridia bacterium]